MTIDHICRNKLCIHPNHLRKEMENDKLNQFERRLNDIPCATKADALRLAREIWGECECNHNWAPGSFIAVDSVKGMNCAKCHKPIKPPKPSTKVERIEPLSYNLPDGIEERKMFFKKIQELVVAINRMNGWE